MYVNYNMVLKMNKYRYIKVVEYQHILVQNAFISTSSFKLEEVRVFSYPTPVPSTKPRSYVFGAGTDLNEREEILVHYHQNRLQCLTIEYNLADYEGKWIMF